jgi:hypothetical protein
VNCAIRCRVYDEDNNVVKDPDEQVQGAVADLFAEFRLKPRTVAEDESPWIAQRDDGEPLERSQSRC